MPDRDGLLPYIRGYAAKHSLGLALVCATFLGGCAHARTLDVIVRGGTIYDGNGGKPYVGDVGMTDGKIVVVEKRIADRAKLVVDARGLAVSPGFIDPHTHVTQALPETKGPFLAEQDISQGVTTVVIGPDGGEAPKVLRDLMSQASTRGVSQDYACYVGHNGIREEVLGHAQRAPTPEELDRMKALVREGMEMGCLGLSAGLMYDPGMFSKHDEIVALAREVKPYGGFYEAHSRNPVTDVVASEIETAEIGIEAGIPGRLGHLKAVGLRNEGKSQIIIDQVDALRAKGYEITGDVYPYDGAATFVITDFFVFPGDEPGESRSAAKTIELLKAALADPARAAAAKDATNNGNDGGFAWVKAVGWDSIRIVDAPGQPEFVGKYLSVLAEERGQDPFDVMADLVLKAKAPIIATVGAMKEADVRNFLVQPWNMISSDGAYIHSARESHQHPRSTGSFTRVLGHYSRDEKLFPLQEAVRKMTSLTADSLRMYDRGRLQPGKVANVVIFDPKTIGDRSTYVQPTLLSGGVRKVFVNGELVWDDGKATGATPGRFVTRQSKPSGV